MGRIQKSAWFLNFFFFQQQQRFDSRVIGVYLVLSTHYRCSGTVAEVRWSFPYTQRWWGYIWSRVQFWACCSERHLAPGESPVKGYKGDEGTGGSGGSHLCVQIPEGRVRGRWSQTLQCCPMTGQRQWAETEAHKVSSNLQETRCFFFFFFLTGTVCLERLWILLSVGDLEKLWCWPSLSRCPYLCRCCSDCVFPGTACCFWTFLCPGLWLCLPLPPSLRNHLHTFPGVEFLPSQTLSSTLASGKPWSCRQWSRKREHGCLESYQRRTGRTGRLKSFLAARKLGVERSQLMML